jgi:hypothetical protein
MKQTTRAVPHKTWTSILAAIMPVIMLACAPAKDSSPTEVTVNQSKLVGKWQGKDPGDQSNITIQIASSSGQYTVTASDDKTTPDWCGVDATASATASLDANQTLNVNLLWVCNNANKTSRGFPTIISYNPSNDTITAYGAPFTRTQ